MKERIVIVLEDLDDIETTLKSLKIFFSKILQHYVNKQSADNLYTFILYCSIYFGNLLQDIGYKSDDEEQL